MPEISRFLGIVIYLYWGDQPLPHFHARYGAYEVSVEIESGIVKGEFPKRALRAVLEWLDEHKTELLQDCQLAQLRKPLNPIAPLE